MIRRMVLACVLFAATVAVPNTASGSGSDRCPGGRAHRGDAVIRTDASVVRVGDSIDVRGSGFCGREEVRITVGATVVAKGRADDRGRFRPHVTIPRAVGDTELCGRGASGLSGDAACQNISVEPETKVAAASTKSGSTALMGDELALLSALALLLLAAGIAFATAGRRPRS